MTLEESNQNYKVVAACFLRYSARSLTVVIFLIYRILHPHFFLEYYICCTNSLLVQESKKCPPSPNCITMNKIGSKMCKSPMVLSKIRKKIISNLFLLEQILFTFHCRAVNAALAIVPHLQSSWRCHFTLEPPLHLYLCAVKRCFYISSLTIAATNTA